jgi:hypothetical protein
MTTMMTIMAARFQKMPRIKSHNKPRQQSTSGKAQKAGSAKGPSTDTSIMQESVTNESPPAEEVLTDNDGDETEGSGNDDDDEDDEDVDVDSVTDEESDDGSVQQQQQESPLLLPHTTL